MTGTRTYNAAPRLQTIESQLETNASQIASLTAQVSRLTDIMEKLTTTAAAHATHIDNLREENRRISQALDSLNGVAAQRQNQTNGQLFQASISGAQMLMTVVWIVIGYLLSWALTQK